MKYEDIEIGMKVVPISKSAGMKIERWEKSESSSWEYFKENGYLNVVDISSDDIIECGGIDGRGVEFLPEDLIPYKETSSIEQEATYLNKVYDIYYLIGRTFKSWRQLDMKPQAHKLTGTLVGCTEPFLGQIQVIDECGALNIIPFDSIILMTTEKDSTAKGDKQK